MSISYFFSLLLVCASMVQSLARQSDPAIDWLRRLQAMQASLNRMPDKAAGDPPRSAADPWALRREIESEQDSGDQLPLATGAAQEGEARGMAPNPKGR